MNLGAAFTLCREMGKYWIKNGINGSLINTASLASFQGEVRMSGYAVSKGGIAMLTKALSNEWATHGIRVNAIAPGYVRQSVFKIIYTEFVRIWLYCDRYER